MLMKSDNKRQNKVIQYNIYTRLCISVLGKLGSHALKLF